MGGKYLTVSTYLTGKEEKNMYFLLGNKRYAKSAFLIIKLLSKTKWGKTQLVKIIELLLLFHHLLRNPRRIDHV